MRMQRGTILAAVASAATVCVAGVSKVDSRYFADEADKTFVPIGCNICFPRMYDASLPGARAECEGRLFGWLRKFAANGGNYTRLWLGHSFFEIMPERAGEYDPAAEATLKRTVKLCEELGIKLKLTLESFRTVHPAGKEGNGMYASFFNRPLYAPYAKNMHEFLHSEECARIYLGKARRLKELGIGDSPAVVCWELWNEINCIGPWRDDVGPWSDKMLAALRELFPRQMTVQNLGSFSAPSSYVYYDYLGRVGQNDFMQAHRYLDPGAPLGICLGPMDILCADAVRELLDRRPDRPAILAEVGAVKANHTGPSELYPKDKQGMLLHDEIFAPFFAGSAGSGQPWHWDHQYIDGNNLWWHFSRFAEAVKGIDPVAEHFRPFRTETRRLRIWGLRGEHTTLLWCRDKANTWERELVRGVPPETISGAEIPFADGGFNCYLPWENRWVVAKKGGILPDFTRSIVVRKQLEKAVACSGFSAEIAAESDVVIYGSSPAAIAAAVQAKRMGRTAVIVSPETRIGGLTTGGLGQTDIGNKSAFGGIALEFYRDVARWYADPDHWTRQAQEEYKPGGQCSGSKVADSMWTFEPSAALAILEGWERRDGLEIRRGEWLDREKGVEKVNGKIVSIRTLSGNVYRGKVFVDATYEGDLMAAAGVSYAVGREANAVYGETLNGNQPARARYHQLNVGVDPYVVAGDSKSGLIFGVEPHDPSMKPGDGDRRVQAYCFRMCLTDDPDNRIPFKKPEGYDERDYELLFRHLAIAPLDRSGMPWINSKMPNRKTDTNNRTGFSTDFIGRNWAWPEASYAEREKIRAAHLKYQRGLMWTLANHPRVPEKIRMEVSRWGTCKDEFDDGLGDGWQTQLYVREARRMVGEYVMTEHNCWGTKVAPHPVAMGAYQMDSHHVRRYVGADGFVHNEGDVEVGVDGKGRRFSPYPIDYGAIVPRRGECGNLIVPVCLSASHIAFGSIRMEPVFFALGQVAGTAASLAAEQDVSVQDVPYCELAKRLVADGQVIGIKRSPTHVALLPMPREIVERQGCFSSTNGFDTVAVDEHPDASIPAEGYRLEVSADGIKSWASSAAGFFYARQTLRQLAEKSDGGWNYPCVEIKDSPAYRWRGVLLDEGRHFFGKETVRQVLDLMAMYKLNVFHWHLTEDQGWRLDIPAYPKLAKCGSVRPASAKHGATLKKVAPFVYRCTEVNTQRYGPFFYTADDVREILDYAKERHIEVVPEIDLPGHAKAALGAYPQLACFPERIKAGEAEVHWGIHRDVFCIGNDETVRFLEDVLDYVCELFPSKVIHIGGDECPRVNWEECPKCQARMKAEGLKTAGDLQAWIVTRMAKHLEKKGRRIMGWDEILNGDVPKSAIGMSWRVAAKFGAGTEYVSPAEGARRGHDMVMTPSPFCYYSARQGLKVEPFEREGRIITFEKAYSFDPVADIPDEMRGRIIGGQGCMWSEYIWNEYDLAWRMWPRTFALAEILWSAPEDRNLAEFTKRAEAERRRLLSMGIHCAPME